jgi:hypothetical protein
MKVSELIKLLERQNPDREVVRAEHKSDILHSTVFHEVDGVSSVEAKWNAYHEAWQERADNDDEDRDTDKSFVVIGE